MIISGMNLYQNGFFVNKSSKAIKQYTNGFLDGDTYEHTEDVESPTYNNINKMSEAERSSLVDQLKQDQQFKQEQFFDLVRKSIGQQANVNEIYQSLANGTIIVDKETAEKAQRDVSESGYWGIKQTSERLFDFACALAGDDINRMKDMQDALHKGFDEATKTWGKKLPKISSDTLDATDKLFENYYKDKGVGVE